MDKISLLISIYQEPLEWIEEALKSVIEQDGLGHLFEIEVCLILDKPERKEEIAGAVFFDLISSSTGVDIQYIINEKNIGLAKSLNIAGAKASGNFFARLDADDICYKERFKLQLKFLNYPGNSQISLVGTNIERIDEDGLHLGFASLPSDPLKLINWAPYKAIAFHPTWLMRRELYNYLAGYRPYPNSQDLDFILRAIEAGFLISNINYTLLKYRINSKSLSVTHSLRQRKCQYHILKMYKLRMNKKDEKFAEASMLKYISSPKLMRKAHSISQLCFLKSRNSNFLIYRYFLLILSFSISPYQLYHFLRILYFKLFVKKL